MHLTSNKSPSFVKLYTCSLNLTQVALTPTQDSSTGASSMPYRALRAIKNQLRDLTLHDTWRTLHPNERDFTFYSSPHNKYTRINHFFISQNDLTLLSKATIDPMVLSDHNPISITLDILTAHTKTTIWCLDNSLLTGLETTQKMNTHAILYRKCHWRFHTSYYMGCA